MLIRRLLISELLVETILILFPNNLLISLSPSNLLTLFSKKVTIAWADADVKNKNARP